MRPKVRLELLVALVGFGYLGDGANGHLRRQAEPLTDVVVHERLQRELVGDAVREGHVRDGVAGDVERLKRPQERSVFFRLRSQFHEQRLLHEDNVSHVTYNVNRRMAPPVGGSAFLPGLTTRGLLRGL